jgi:hypothetical protein
MFVEINFKERMWLICGLYRPPSMTDDVFTEDFTKTFDKVSEKYDSPQLKFLIFWQWLGLFVIITSKSDGSAIFVKQVAVLTRLEKSKTSHIVIKGPHLSKLR